MPTVAHALTTKEKVKQLLEISDTSKDALIDAIISFVTDWIEGACGRRFIETEYTDEIYDVNGGRKLYLRQYPASEIASLEYNAGSLGVPSWVAVPAADYALYGAAGYVQFAYDLPNLPSYLRITYTAGYLIDFTDELDTTAHTLPFDLCQLATELCVRAYTKRGTGGTIRESTEGQSIDWATDLPKDHLATIAKYAEHSF